LKLSLWESIARKSFENLFSLWESLSMAAQELDSLISELTSWCKAKHGRQRELAAMLGVSEQLVSNWLARRKTPTLQHGLQIQEFLKRRGKGRKKDG
jgi:DNA-binding transcriptional regulator YiaG